MMDSKGRGAELKPDSGGEDENDKVPKLCDEFLKYINAIFSECS